MFEHGRMESKMNENERKKNSSFESKRYVPATTYGSNSLVIFHYFGFWVLRRFCRDFREFEQIKWRLLAFIVNDDDDDGPRAHFDQSISLSVCSIQDFAILFKTNRIEQRVSTFKE